MTSFCMLKMTRFSSAPKTATHTSNTNVNHVNGSGTITNNSQNVNYQITQCVFYEDTSKESVCIFGHLVH